MFTVYLFAADPEKLRDKLANDEALLSEIRARIIRERSPTPEATDEMCAHVAAARRLDWPRPGKMLSVNAFLWMLDYAAEPINAMLALVVRLKLGSKNSARMKFVYQQYTADPNGENDPSLKPTTWGKGWGY